MIAAASLLLFGVYHAWLVSRVRRRPDVTAFGQARRARAAWVRSVMTERRDILAVQTLRNWTMGASFLASTAVIVIMGLLSVVLTSDRLPALVHNLNLVGSTVDTLLTFKLLCLVACLLFSFVNFTVAIRYYNHVVMDINVPLEQSGAVSCEGVSMLLERGALHYTLGMRGYYLSLLLVLWLFGPLWMVAGSVLLCLALFGLDRSAGP